MPSNLDVSALLHGGTFIPLAGKKPLPQTSGKWGRGLAKKLSERERVALVEDAPDEANAGLLCGHERIEMPDGTHRGVLILDIDSKPERFAKDGTYYPAQRGPEVLALLERTLGPLPKGLTCITASGARHRYFDMPADVEHVSNKVFDRFAREHGFSGSGIEVQNEGHQVVFAASKISPDWAERHGCIAGEYAWEDESAKVPALPDAWVAFMLVENARRPEREDCEPIEPCPLDPESKSGKKRIKQAETYLAKAPLSIRGQGGRSVFFGVCVVLVCKMRLPHELAADLIERVYSPRLVAAGTTAWSRDTPGPHGMTIMSRLEDAAKDSSAAKGTVADEIDDAIGDWSSGKNATKSYEEVKVMGARVAAKPADPPSFACTDLGNAERFAHQHRESARFVGAWGSWMVWDGKRWQRDTSNRVALLAKETARSIDGEVQRATDENQRGLLRKHATRSESRAGIDNMLALARGELAAAPNDFDVDPWLLNVANGTIDLRTGQLRPHAREDMLTKLAPVDFDPDAPCPQWDAFVSWAMAGNAELVSFLRRVVGYSLAGVTSEHALFFSHGDGRNGKGVFHNTVARIVGDYASKAPRGLLIESRNEKHPTELADLHGARFVLCAEVKQGQRFDEGLVKDLVGEDRIKARRMHENFWEFVPTHTLFLCGNHKPVIHGSDEGIWRRIRLVPWLVQVSEEKKDNKLADKLALESSGILAWAVRGCLEWQANGLGAPGAVQEATESFRKESNRLHDFLEARCKLEPESKVARRSLRAAYVAWCTEVGREPLGDKMFIACLRERGVSEGGTVRQKPNPNPVDAWKGIALV